MQDTIMPAIKKGTAVMPDLIRQPVCQSYERIQTISRTVVTILLALCIVAAIILLCLQQPSAPPSNPPQKISAGTETGCTQSGATDRALLLRKPVPGPDMDVHTAMTFLFPAYDRDLRIAVWCPAKDAEIYKYLYHKNLYSDVQTMPAFTAHYQQGGRSRFIMIFQTERYFDSCHACTVVLGGAVFTQKSGQWSLTAMTHAIAAAGNYGKAPPDMSLEKAGPDIYAVAVRDGYMQHGIYVENYLLLGPVGDRVEQILYLSGSSGNNKGHCGDSNSTPISPPKCYDYDVGITFHRGSHPIYSDIEVTVEGTRYDDYDVFGPFQNVSQYRFDGCRYTQGAGIDMDQDKPYYIQVAAFENYRSACNLVQELQGLGYPAYCRFHRPHAGNSFFRVRIGNYTSAREAEQTHQRINRTGYGGFVSHR